MSKESAVPRPLKRTEFVLVFITSQAQKGWVDCLATARNAAVDAWECLTRTPDLEGQRLYRLKGDFATGTYQGVTYGRYRYKITDGGRIWYFIDRTQKDKKTAGRVLIERCSTAHPRRQIDPARAIVSILREDLPRKSAYASHL